MGGSKWKDFSQKTQILSLKSEKVYPSFTEYSLPKKLKAVYIKPNALLVPLFSKQFRDV